ncbi:SDR family NAD(P)-dependent oxidoreductase [Hellea balneolensis]|uniref:SDR family NAD(P)-dependent oxidoreductase n=1 Tax=Hellea balneolensis TaxID=287478 RepID=UPI00041E9F53|nr:SDR family NAD(P)-dependent oxidoreductase [Hellea balneolensis]
MPKPNNQDANSLLVLGGTSAVALAYARLRASEGKPIILVGRNSDKLKLNQADLAARTKKPVDIHVCDLSDTAILDKNWNAVTSMGHNISEVFLAYGLLGDQLKTQKDSQKFLASLNTNFVSAAMWAEKAFDHFAYKGSGQITVIGSVAGDRGRQSNYHYGTAKGALEIFCDGMAHRAARFKGAKINILLVKPGFIDTPMTDHLDKGGLLWASPEKIAKITLKAVFRGKRKIYAPWFWRFILLLIRMTPRFAFHKTGL